MNQEKLVELLEGLGKTAKDLTEGNKKFLEGMDEKLAERAKPIADAKIPTSEEIKEQKEADGKSWSCFAEFAHKVAIAGKTHERVVDKRLVPNTELKATDISESDSEYGGYGQNALIKPCYMLETHKSLHYSFAGVTI